MLIKKYVEGSEMRLQAEKLGFEVEYEGEDLVLEEESTFVF